MMASYVADSTEPEKQDFALPVLAGLLVAFVTVTTTLLLGSTAHHYLQVLTENLDPNVTAAQEELETQRLKHLGDAPDESMTLKRLVLPQEMTLPPSIPQELKNEATPAKLHTDVLWVIGGFIGLAWILSVCAIWRSTYLMQAAIKNRVGTTRIELKTPGWMFWAITLAVFYVALGPGFAGVYSLDLGWSRSGYIIVGLLIGAVYPLVLAVLLCCSLPRPKPPPTTPPGPPRLRQNTSSGAVTVALLLVIANTWRK